MDLGQDKIDEIVNSKVQHFYEYSKKLSGVLDLFNRLYSEKRAFRNYQGGFEDLQLEEANRQKDLLFSALLKSPVFVEALEKIIMSPILIGSKNKD